MNNVKKYKEEFERTEKMDLTIAERDRAIANLMTTMEIENGGINKIITRNDETTEFYTFIRDERKL